jgi:hypothetical protein
MLRIALPYQDCYILLWIWKLPELIRSDGCPGAVLPPEGPARDLIGARKRNPSMKDLVCSYTGLDNDDFAKSWPTQESGIRKVV